MKESVPKCSCASGDGFCMNLWPFKISRIVTNHGRFENCISVKEYGCRNESVPECYCASGNGFCMTLCPLKISRIVANHGRFENCVPVA